MSHFAERGLFVLKILLLSLSNQISIVSLTLRSCCPDLWAVTVHSEPWMTQPGFLWVMSAYLIAWHLFVFGFKCSYIVPHSADSRVGKWLHVSRVKIVWARCGFVTSPLSLHKEKWVYKQSRDKILQQTVYHIFRRNPRTFPLSLMSCSVMISRLLRSDHISVCTCLERYASTLFTLCSWADTHVKLTDPVSTMMFL